MNKIVVIAHDIRSAHNIGSLLRTCDGLGVDRVYMTGYTPHPEASIDQRLPHIASRVTKMIHKTALGAENSVNWEAGQDIHDVIDKLRAQNFKIIGLELSQNAVPLHSFAIKDKIALLLGNEIRGIEQSLLDVCDSTVFIPMLGQKESLNVTEAASMALYYLRYIMNTVQ
jgi:23S rRNA (guanosine2251-2'-O)-methyltransferase